MKHLFVKYPLALNLKEKGFNEDCLGYYKELNTDNINPLVMIWNDNMYPIHNDGIGEWWGKCAAPLYQQVVDWFEQVHDIYIGKTGYNDSVTPKRWVYHVNGIYVPVQSMDGAIEYALTLI